MASSLPSTYPSSSPSSDSRPSLSTVLFGPPTSEEGTQIDRQCRLPLRQVNRPVDCLFGPVVVVGLQSSVFSLRRRPSWSSILVVVHPGSHPSWLSSVFVAVGLRSHPSSKSILVVIGPESSLGLAGKG
ncbi:hypothetical protein TYRP_018068 [Tyrophagus putrescentiae]|nr:hypothetical protein TYRP_007053 [Tyrophagus putrescentiae]KAH9399161.1 hypothetical protein TYRP_018068 [Tyrophagus putrescentiae]